ncbi:MAG TPA: acyltransferase family protein [Solirubrobacterales bacterium]|nr:acyltransferase family protein [Solirubrobacterales bacterium]
MPEPIGRGRRYMPGLDGLRALAVLAVIAFHLGFGWVPGGLLGVGVFFTLSGYLITDLLLAQSARRGAIRLGGFWLGRARRLLPALFLMLAVVLAWVTVIGPHQPPSFREAVAAALLYVSNWWLIFQHVSYFARFGQPSPLNHLWSLAVEEQFYIVWPFLLLLGIRFVREVPLPSGLRPRLAGATLLLAAASAAAMALLYHPSLDPSRVYYGTDTRACELLIGAALAMVWPSRRLTAEIVPAARRILDGLGVAGLLAIGFMVWRTNEYSPFLYRGGFALLALASALLIAALAHPACRLGPVLGWRPLRWIGVRSYAIYLWHYPIIVLTTPAGARGVDLFRDALQVGATFGIAALSWHYVEQPARHGALGRLLARARAGGWRREEITRRGWVILAALAVILVLACAGLAGVGSSPAPAESGRVVARTIHSPLAGVPGGAGALAGHTSCHSVIHIGDSTSEGLISPEYLPNPKQRISAQYARIGATTQHFDISGARSIVETYEGQPNAYEVARAWRAQGYHGCWVLALGTNDAADVYVGSSVDQMARIRRMMSVIGEQPVMWVNVKSLVESGPYAEHNMALWDQSLLQACRSYPYMRVYDWAAAVRNKWFIEDGIHFTSPGYVARSRLIAHALAKAFPAGGGESRSCLVH